jgi:hypothetical protein
MKRIPCFSLASLAVCGLALSSAAQTISPTGPSAYRIVNVTDDFVAYYRECLGLDPACRTAGWEKFVESRHPQFIEEAVYRGKGGAEKERYKQDCIRRFWDEIAPRIPQISELDFGIETRVHEIVRRFRRHLPDFEPRTDFYLTISFSFKGKVLPVNGRDVLAIGMEAFQPSEIHQFEITLAHELFHLYHFGRFSASGALYRALWTEGLATYASAVVAPGHRRSVYLGFSPAKMNRCDELLPLMAADFRRHMGEYDPRLSRIYFGAEPNDTQVPPEAGYYLGLRIAEKLARENPLDELAKKPAAQVFDLLRRELEVLAAEKGG